MIDSSTSDDQFRLIRRRNWIAIVVASIPMMFATLTYASAFIDGDGDSVSIDPPLALIALAVVPFVFIGLGFLSQNPTVPRDALRAMGLMLLVGLSVGLIDPVLGSASGFAVGGALALNRPDIPHLIKWRAAAVGFVFLYCFALLMISAAAGVFTAAILPFIMVGFADEYASWSAGRDQASA